MSIQGIWGAPGVRSPRTAQHRIVFKGGQYDLLPGGMRISGTYSRDPGNTDHVYVLRPGLIMGKRTADDLYAPSILGVTTNAEAIGSTSIEVAAAVVTELVRRVGSSGTFKLTGPATSGGTVVTETVTYSAASGTTITCTAIANAFVAGSFVQPTDGSETPLTVIPDGWGIRVVDVDLASVDVEYPSLPIGGILFSSQLLPAWPSDTSLRLWLAARLNDVPGGRWQFSHHYGA